MSGLPVADPFDYEIIERVNNQSEYTQAEAEEIASRLLDKDDVSFYFTVKALYWAGAKLKTNMKSCARAFASNLALSSKFSSRLKMLKTAMSTSPTVKLICEVDDLITWDISKGPSSEPRHPYVQLFRELEKKYMSDHLKAL